MLLESFTKPPSGSAADRMFKSVLCGRCGTVNYHHLLFLKALQNIHLGQLRITFSSPFCVAGVGRSIITIF